MDLASAWATEGAPEGDAVDALERASDRGLKVRALVGLHHNITTPSALARLREIGELRVVDGGRLFHPKVYLFRHEGGGGFAWIGSANFTGKGFGVDGQRNEEVMFETQAIRDVAKWFKCRWEQAGTLDEGTLEKYCKEYRPPKQGALDERPGDAAEASVRAPKFLEPVAAWGKANPDRRLPPTAYIPAILQTLHDMGGRGARPEVLWRVREVMEPVLRRVDHELHRENERNWEHQSDEARQKMAVRYRFVQPAAVTGNGVWGLTREGMEASKGDYGVTWRRWATRALR